jgi:hypothetical protein
MESMLDTEAYDSGHTSDEKDNKHHKRRMMMSSLLEFRERILCDFAVVSSPSFRTVASRVVFLVLSCFAHTEIRQNESTIDVCRLVGAEEVYMLTGSKNMHRTTINLKYGSGESK